MELRRSLNGIQVDGIEFHVYRCTSVIVFDRFCRVCFVWSWLITGVLFYIIKAEANHKVKLKIIFYMKSIFKNLKFSFQTNENFSTLLSKNIFIIKFKSWLIFIFFLIRNNYCRKKFPSLLVIPVTNNFETTFSNTQN